MNRLACLGLLALVACASSPNRRGPAARPWHTVDTAELTVVTDLGPDAAVALARDALARRAVLEQVYAEMLAPGTPRPTSRILLVHTARCHDFWELFGTASITGSASLVSDHLAEPIAITCADRHRPATLEAVSHELAHLLAFHFLPALPAWLEEGLATYVQTLAIGSDEVVLGAYPAYHHDPFLALPTVERLRAMSQREFGQVPGAHLMAWRLVHLLATGGDDRSARLRRLLRALADGAPEPTAWNAAFAGWPAGQLATEYRDYLPRPALGHWLLPYRPPAPPALTARPLDRGEIHDTWMKVLISFGSPSQRTPRARAYLDQAIALAPEWAGGEYWSAVLASRSGVPPAAILPGLRRYVARAPGELRGALALAQCGLAGLGEDLFDPTPPPGVAEMRPIVESLVAFPRSSRALDIRAWYFAVAREPAAGVELARRAVAIEPGCATLRGHAGHPPPPAGDAAAAATHQERAIQLLRGGTPPPDWQRRLATYRAASQASISATADRDAGAASP